MKAYKLLEKPEHWTTGQFARDAEGRGCHSHSTRAVSWCARGAIEKCYKDLTVFPALERLWEAIGARVGIINWNDDPKRTHAQVVAMLKKANV